MSKGKKSRFGYIAEREDSVRIWNWLNQKLQFDFPYPKIGFILLKWKDFQKIFLSSISSGYNNEPRNEHEKEIWKSKDYRLINETDGMLEDKKYFLEKKVEWPFPDRYDYVMLMCKGIPPTRRGFTFSACGFTGDDYEEYVILHELLHVLEHFSGKQLFTGKEDLELFLEYKGRLDLKIIKES